MKYDCKVWPKTATGPIDAEFLSAGATAYLRGCESEIYADWEVHFPSEKSLAGVLSRTLIKRFTWPGFAIGSETSEEYGVAKAFHHQKSTSDLWVEILNSFNHNQVSDYLVITQTQHFKEKFLYDKATMTIDTLVMHYSHFVTALKLENQPKLFFLVLDDLSFGTDVLVRGKKQYLKLERS